MKNKIVNFLIHIMWIIVYTSLFTIASISYGRFLNYLAEKYDETYFTNGKDKSDALLILEICIELGANSVGVYIFKKIINFLINKVFNLKTSPDEIAAIIVSPVIFSQQPKLMEKISNLYNNL